MLVSTSIKRTRPERSADVLSGTALVVFLQFCLLCVMSPAFGHSAPSKSPAAAKSAAEKNPLEQEQETDRELRKELNIPEPPSVHGFHPIKQTMAEMSEIASINLRLYEQIKKMEIPVAQLQPTMLQLQSSMVHVDNQMDVTHTQLTSVGDQMTAMFTQMGKVGERMGAVQAQIGGVGVKMDAMEHRLHSVGDKMKGMHEQLVNVQGQVKQMEVGMTGLRDDLKAIRSDLTAVRTQVNGLQRPIEQIRDPLLEVAGPLEGLGKRLDRLQAIVSDVLKCIVLAAIGIAFGTPIAFFVMYKLFADRKSIDKVQ